MNALRFALGIFSGKFILILQNPADCGLPGFAFSREGPQPANASIAFSQLCTFIASECKKLSLSGELASHSDD